MNPLLPGPRRGSPLALLNALLGAWLAISAFVFKPHGNALHVSLQMGIMVLVMGAARFFFAPKAYWLSWLNVVAGLWAAASPWSLAFARHQALTWNSLVVGLAIAATGLFAATAPVDLDDQPR